MLPRLKDTVAPLLYKLMAYKDEYEVARLLTRPEFEQQTREMWESVESISYNLHPPMLRRFGVHRKLKLGAWFRVPLRVLARLKDLRGTPLDVFGMESAPPAWSAIDRVVQELIRRVMDDTKIQSRRWRWRSPHCPTRFAATSRSKSGVLRQ